MSGEEFRRAFYAREFDDMWALEVRIVATLLPLVEQQEMPAVANAKGTTMVAQPSETDLDDLENHPSIRHLTREEAAEEFDRVARYWLNMSGDEFRRAFYAREFDDMWAAEVRIVAMALPLVENQ